MVLLGTGGGMTAAATRWPVDEVDARWNAVEWHEREAWLRYGWRAAPWEDAPTFAARILKGDSKLTLANAAKLVVIFRAAYDSMVTLDAAAPKEPR